MQQQKKQIFRLTQEIEFKNMEIVQLKFKENQLRRLNQTLVLALAEDRPNIVNQIKLIYQACSNPSERQLQLQEQNQKLNKQIENQIEIRVKRIKQLSKYDFQHACTKCTDFQIKFKNLEAQERKLRLQLSSKNMLMDKVKNEYESRLSQKDCRVNDLETELRSCRQNQQKDIEKIKQSQWKQSQYEKSEAIDKLQNQYQQTCKKLEAEFNQRLQSELQFMEQSYQKILSDKQKQIQLDFSKYYESKIIQLEEQHAEELMKLTRQQQQCTCKKQNKFEGDDFSKFFNKLTVTKNRQALQEISNNNIELGTQSFMGRGSLQNNKKHVPQEKQMMKEEIKNIISGITKNKQNSKHFIIGDSNEESNFSIKDSIIRPSNTLFQSHIRFNKKKY